MNHKEQFRYRASATTEHPQDAHGGCATEPNDVGKDNGVTRRGRLRIPGHPVQDRDPEKGAAEHPEIGDQCGGGVRWNGRAIVSEIEIRGFLSWLLARAATSSSPSLDEHGSAHAEVCVTATPPLVVPWAQHGALGAAG